MPWGIFQRSFLQVLPSVPVPSSPLKQGEEVLLRKKKRFSPNFLQLWTILIILTIFFLQVQGSLLLPTCAWWWAGTEGISNWSFHNVILKISQFYFSFSGWSESWLHVWGGGWLVEGEGGRQSKLKFDFIDVISFSHSIVTLTGWCFPLQLCRDVWRWLSWSDQTPCRNNRGITLIVKGLKTDQLLEKQFLSLALFFRRLSSCRHHWRRGLWPRLWRRKTRKILSGQTGEQQFPWEGLIM